MTIESMLFVAYIGVIMPLLIVQTIKRGAATLERTASSRVSIYVGTGVLQAIYLALAIPVARIEGIPSSHRWCSLVGTESSSVWAGSW